MTDRERELREKIRKECWSCQRNFSGIDILMRMENDWRVAKEEGNYSFESCPSYFDCLDGFVGLCEEDDGSEYSAKQYIKLCIECWKKALRGEDSD